ncbi:hypothetical protein HPB52_015785 [Rhipicephalus sanguineus]|uniref:ABC transporter domain-containing protein n=1 Tax=Rhipicephalus sanguineus TaxID=34632 RepID=A0A9D4PWN5_RHISA|nr:hypothetical protein HPB52_015785 [Rhipicephalus sanguineus]
MQMLQALAVVLWKNLWVQPFRHHYISTAAEMVIVVLCFGVLWNRERPAPGTLRRSTDALVYNEEPALDEAFVHKQHVVVYGPPFPYANEIMSAFQPTSSKQQTISAKSAPKPQKKMRYVAEKAAEVALTCADVRRQFHGENQSVICISFEEETLGTLLLNYTVYLTTHYKGDYSPGLKFPWTFRKPPEDIDVYDQMQKIMAVVETRHIELQTNSEFSYDEIHNQRVHVDEDVADSSGIEGLRSNMENKSKKHWPPEDGEDLQMIMGLSSLQSTLGHVITGVVLTLLQSLVPVFCMTVLPSRGPATDHAYLQGANVTLLLFVFLMFSVMLSFQALLVATIFINTSMAIMFGVFYWVILTLAGPLMIIDGPAPSLARYVFTSELTKYYSSYTPCLGTYWMLKMIGIAVDFDGTADWDIFWTFAFGLDSITIGYVVTTMAESFVLMLFLIWYLSVVLPWNSKTPRPFYFLFQISYWIPTEQNVSSVRSKYKRPRTHHEEPPDTALVVASVRAVTMNFGNLIALDSVDFKILDKQITVILGHNAAGKTTILKTLAGIVSPTKGFAQVCGYDVATHPSMARKNISFCQQDDVFFTDLTVSEHLIYFGLLKGVPYSLIKQRAEEVLDDLYLTDCQYALPSHLSGGVIKRLSVAIAVVSRPKVILMDEPTAGIDPENRGDVWDLLLDLRQTINLSELSEKEMGAWLNKEDDVTTASSLVTVQPNLMRTMLALLSKRALCLSRSCVALALAWVAPFTIFWVMLIFEKSALHGVAPLLTDRILVPITLDSVDNEETNALEHALTPYARLVQAFVQFGRDQAIPAAAYRALAEQQGATATTFVDAPERLLFLASQNFIAYSQKLVVGAVFDENGTVEAWFNPYLRGGKAIAMSMVHTALLRNLTEGGKVTPGLEPAALISSSETVVEGTLASFERVVSAMSSTSAITMAARALFLPLVAGVLVAAFSLFPTAERASRAKDIQMMTGMSGCTYWTSNYLFDLQTYITVWALMGVLHSFYYAVTMETSAALLLAVLAFSIVGLASAYTVSLFAKTQPGAFSFIALTFTIIGTALTWNQMILTAERRYHGEDLVKQGGYEYAMALVPAFAFPRALTKTLELDRENQDCLNRRHTLIAGHSLLWHLCSRDPTYRLLGAGIYYCCQMELTNSTDWEPLSPFGFHSSGILAELIIMVTEGVILFVLLDRLDSGQFLWMPGPPAPAGQGAEATAADDEVRQERKLVDAEVAKRKFADVAMAARGLGKKYGTTEVVRSVSLALRNSECFGLLGLNGSGKTTTLEMLAALLPPTSGDAYRSDLCMSEDPRKWQSRVGYCPQSGGLLEQLTGSEFLRLIANLRGVPHENVDRIVRSLLRVVGVADDEAEQPCGSYSNGAKRKLSVAAAIVGLPRIVLLDEPAARVDILARRTIFQALQAIIRKGYSSIILSSNCMDVCEANCNRVAILVSGQLQCLGSVDQLLLRFGHGFTLQVKCVAKDAGNATALEQAVVALFPGIILTDVHPGLFQFSMKEMMQWSVLFARVNQLQRQFQLEYVNVSSTGLEEVFVGFVRDTRRPALSPTVTSPRGTSSPAAPAAAVITPGSPAGAAKGTALAPAK